MSAQGHQKGRGSVDGGKPAASRLQSHDGTRGRKDSDGLKRMKRANTYHSDHQPDAAVPGAPDTFETAEHTDNEDTIENSRASIELDELPIELITLTDR